MEGTCFKHNDKFDDFLRDYVEIWQLVKDRHRCDLLVPFLVLHAFCGACTAYLQGQWCHDDGGDCIGYEEGIAQSSSSVSTKLWALLIVDLILVALVFKANNASSHWHWTRGALGCYGMIVGRDGTMATLFLTAQHSNDAGAYVVHMLLIVMTLATNLIVGGIVVGMWLVEESRNTWTSNARLKRFRDKLDASGLGFSCMLKARYATEYFYRMLRPESAGFHPPSPSLLDREIKSFR